MARPLLPDDPAAIGPYRLTGRLGEGGQGVVYLGQAPDGTPVAVKVLQDGLAGDGRFAKEIAAARRVEPFCIAQVLDASLGGRPYIVTEYVAGPPLSEAGRHAGADLQRLAVATATALAAIHRAGVVHRDFKPANVLLGRDGPRVIDFGIARAADSSVTVTSSIVGTPSYMAPEQLGGAALGPPVDVFAWASVMVFAATGTPPFGNDSLPAVIRRILYDEPWLGDVPEPLRSVVRACLVKDPSARPAMQDVLLHLIGGRPMPPVPGPPARPPGAPGHPPMGGRGPAGDTRGRAAEATLGRRRRRRRNPLVAGGAAGLSAVVLASAVFWLPDLMGGTPGTGTGTGTSTSTGTGTGTGTLAASAPATGAGQPASSPSPSRARKRRTPGPGATATKSPKTDATKTAPPEPAETRTTSKPRATEPAEATGGSITSLKLIIHRPEKPSGCYPRGNEVYAMIRGTEGAKATYRWIVNGVDQGRSTTYLSREERMMQGSHLDGPGRNTVVLRFETPQRVERRVSFTMCEDYF